MNYAIIIVIIIIILCIFLKIKQNKKNQNITNLYFDNNGTTFPHPEVINTISRSFNLGNASASYADDAKDILKKCRNIIQNWVQSPSTVIFTSGASESNNLIIKSVVDKWWMEKKIKPHVIISAIEHKTSLECCKNLKNLNRIDITYLHPNSQGIILPQLVMKSIQPNTCIISIIHANNELGTINDIKQIGQIAKNNRIIFHTDATQSFGKYSIPMKKWNIDAISASFHKFYGPPGLGLLILNPYIRLPAQISGTQNFGMRGGTENLPAIAGAITTMKITTHNRFKKNQRLLGMKNYIKKYLLESQKNNTTYNVIFLTPEESLPNTLMLSIIFKNYKNYKSKDNFCNIKFKKDLLQNKAIISIGSACNTLNSGPSHVLLAIGAPYYIRCGVIRISLGDYNTLKECKKLCQLMTKCIKKQLKDKKLI